MSTQVQPQIAPAPVRKSIRVEVSPETAFEAFTAGIGRWWPKTHKIGVSELDRPVIEPRQGGRWYQLGVDGSECEVGRVLAWEPPSRLLLAWQLNSDWAYDPDLVTEVEVIFTADGSGTRVDLEHRHLERMGDRAGLMREMVDSPNGWGGLLMLYAEEASR